MNNRRGTSKRACRYFSTPRGCRNGDDCSYAHVLPVPGAPGSGVKVATEQTSRLWDSNNSGDPPDYTTTQVFPRDSQFYCDSGVFLVDGILFKVRYNVTHIMQPAIAT
jgi:hypothetical protein